MKQKFVSVTIMAKYNIEDGIFLKTFGLIQRGKIYNPHKQLHNIFLQKLTIQKTRNKVT